MIQISIFSIVLLIVVLHTILTHLLNWLFRLSTKDNDGLVMVVTLIIMLESIVCIAMLDNFLT